MVEIDPADRVLCLFREGSSLGLVFDFNPLGSLDRAAFVQTLDGCTGCCGTEPCMERSQPDGFPRAG